ncbi:MAG: hypothetical protein ABJC36_00765 [Gemmatimonadales bacterium]
MNSTRAAAALIALVALACTEPAGPTAGGNGGLRPSSLAAGVEESVTGGGQFFHPDFGTVTLAFTATRHADGRVTGRWQQNQFDLGVAYKGDVTCFAVDPVNHRAWIGGVITWSNDPDPLAVVGRDAWFRVLDLGHGPDPDRSTFLGFQGSAGIETSAEYCAVRLWAPDNARTWPVEHGNIAIH